MVTPVSDGKLRKNNTLTSCFTYRILEAHICSSSFNILICFNYYILYIYKNRTAGKTRISTKIEFEM